MQSHRHSFSFKGKDVQSFNKGASNRSLLFALSFALILLLCFGGVVFAETTVPGGDITQNTIWTKTEAPYIVTGNVTIRAGATLTIQPGVTVRFAPGTGLYIGGGDPNDTGTLLAQGTAAQPVVFTSNALTPAPGDWSGLYFDDGTVDTDTLLEQCVVEYGGTYYGSDVYLVHASPTITATTMRWSSGYGLRLRGEVQAVITGNQIVANSSYGIYGETGDVAAEMGGNTLQGNGEYAVFLHPNSVRGVQGTNTGSGNGANHPNEGSRYDVIAMSGGALTISGTWRTVTAQSLPYGVTGNVTIRGGATVVIEPDVTVKFERDTGLYIGGGDPNDTGTLLAQGTAAQPVVFTSNALTPAPGDWWGLYFDNGTVDAETKLEHCVVEYGGSYYNANVYLAHASPTIQYNTLRASSHSGIIVNGTGSNNAKIRCNNLKENLYGVYITGNAQPEISTNNFLVNKPYGVYNESSVQVNAANNWWGDSDGPNLNGTMQTNGDWVSSN